VSALERQAPDTRHQAAYIPDSCLICVTIRRRHWTLQSADVRTLDAFHQKCLRQLLGIRWYDQVRNDEVLQRTGLISLSHLLSRRRISVCGSGKNREEEWGGGIVLRCRLRRSGRSIVAPKRGPGQRCRCTLYPKTAFDE